MIRKMLNYAKYGEYGEYGENGKVKRVIRVVLFYGYKYKLAIYC